MKMKTGIGVTTLCAMLAAVPAFGYANAAELDVSGSETVVESSTELAEQPDTLNSITENEVTEALGEVSTEAGDPTGTDESTDLPGSEETDEEEPAVILPAEGQVDDVTMESDNAGSVVTVDLEDVLIIPEDGVNGSFVSNYEDTLPVEWSDEFGRELYNAYAVCYQDENLSRLAGEYLNKGYFISDLKKEGELLGAGIGYGDYYFNSGFCAVDDITGNNSFITYVAKISQTDFDKFVKELGDHWTKKSATEYTCNDGANDATVIFDPATGILIYTNNLPANSEG